MEIDLNEISLISRCVQIAKEYDLLSNARAYMRGIRFTFSIMCA
jgi:HD-GYP domain-containing protein (c-di-GMP phosphodiesterase class II)